jgi:membrane protease YdiL (CAAX protease family)
MKRQHSRTWYAAIACIVFVIGTHVTDLMRLAGSRRFIHGWASLGVANLLQVILSVWGLTIAHATGIKRAIGELGLRAPIGRAAIFAFIAGLPMLIAFALTSRLNPSISVLTVGVGCFLAPFAEEVLFRGYMFGQLYCRARWGFWLSALIPSALFAFGHAYQATGMLELTGIFAVTGLGSLLGCWLFMRWQYNLWVVFGLHCLMNLWWELFGIDDSALGGWIANGARLLTVTVAILLTIYKDRFWTPLDSTRTHLTGSDNNSSKENRAEASVPNNDKFSLVCQPAV